MFNTYIPPERIEPIGDGSILGPWWELVTHIVPQDEERYMFLQHMAATVQQPQRKINWQILIQGAAGIGKDALLTPVVRYFGSAAAEVSKEELDAGWGDTRAHKKVLVFSEVWRPGDRQFANSIKTLAADTASGLDKLNLKGGSIIEQRNLYSIYCMSNHEDALHIDPDERRWFVLQAFNIPVMPVGWYVEYYNWIDRGGWKNVISWLMALDLSDFAWGRLPFHTEASAQLREAGRSNSAQYLADLLEAGEFPFNGELVSLGQVEAFVAHSHMINGGQRKTINRNILAKELVEIGCLKLHKRGRRSLRVDGKKIQQQTPILYVLENEEIYNAMSEPELYDACPENLFINDFKKFDEKGNIRKKSIKENEQVH